MKVYEGRSAGVDAEAAVIEATSGWPDTVEMIFAFHSPRLDAQEVAAKLARTFPATRIVGLSLIHISEPTRPY